MPDRIQRRRSKGWRMPPGAIYVGRPTRWGNPITVGTTGSISAVAYDGVIEEAVITITADIAVEMYRQRLEAWFAPMGPNAFAEDLEWQREQVETLEQLRGRDLVCWCPLDRTCHADVLLEIANRPVPDGEGS